jgi:hypothetical protein
MPYAFFHLKNEAKPPTRNSFHETIDFTSFPLIQGYINLSETSCHQEKAGLP